MRIFLSRNDSAPPSPGGENGACERRTACNSRARAGLVLLELGAGGDDLVELLAHPLLHLGEGLQEVVADQAGEGLFSLAVELRLEVAGQVAQRAGDHQPGVQVHAEDVGEDVGDVVARAALGAAGLDLVELLQREVAEDDLVRVEVHGLVESALVEHELEAVEVAVAGGREQADQRGVVAGLEAAALQAAVGVQGDGGLGGALLDDVVDGVEHGVDHVVVADGEGLDHVGRALAVVVRRDDDLAAEAVEAVTSEHVVVDAHVFFHPNVLELNEFSAPMVRTLRTDLQHTVSVLAPQMMASYSIGSGPICQALANL